jgi:hypothetical protein
MGTGSKNGLVIDRALGYFGKAGVLGWSAVMAFPEVKSGESEDDLVHDLDRVKLLKPVTAKGRVLEPGLLGTVVFCYDREAYEVEFDEFDDVYQIKAEDLTKI